MRRIMALIVAGLASATAVAEPVPEARAITHGPKHHWFGYYDKLQLDPSQRYVLGMEVDFEGRTPRPDDAIGVGMVDLQDGDRWIPLGTSSAWGWQQGCMLQWRPGSSSEVLWNDREGDRYVCRILDTRTRHMRTIPWPVYSVSPDGKTAVTADFRRIQDVRPGYGYVGLPDPHKDDLAPDGSGIWRVDLDSGEAELIVSLAQLARLPLAEGAQADPLEGAKHWFNHLLINTDGTRFIFLHRWRQPGGKRFYTRMCTANLDGTDVRVVDPYGRTSHFIWRDPKHILAWAWHPSHEDGFYLFEDGSDRVELIGEGVMEKDGHCTYLPGNEWILCDGYPGGPERLQTVYLYHVASGKRVDIGAFPSPPEYAGEWRCDTHPRFSPDGKQVVIDSPHRDGRQMYMIDISPIVSPPQE